MHSSSFQQSGNYPASDLLGAKTPGWDQGSFVLNELIQGNEDLNIRASEPLLSNESDLINKAPLATIGSVGINLHVSPQCSEVSSDHLLNMLLTDLRESMPNWKHRPLGDVYWNRQLIEQLDEGSLTELTFNLTNKLKKSDRHYRHTAELAITETSLSKLAILRGLGVTKLILCLPLLRDKQPQLAGQLIQIGSQVREQGYQDISIRLTYDSDHMNAEDLIGLLLDLPMFGPHELLFNPVQYSQKIFHSLWESHKALHESARKLSSIRKLLLSEGYEVMGYDQLIFNGDQQLSAVRERAPVYFSPIGHLHACSPDFVGIGPGALSRLGQYLAVNHANFAHYSELLARGMYPRKSCKKINQSFIAIENEIIKFLLSLQIDMAKASKILGAEHIMNVRQQLSSLPDDFWKIDSSERLTLNEQSRDWLPMICAWLVQQQPDHHSNSIIWH